MKYSLFCKRGKYENGKFAIDWSHDVEGTIVFAAANNIHISSVCHVIDEIHIGLNQIPARIDIEDCGNIWLLDEADVSRWPDKPYCSMDSNASRTIYTRPDIILTGGKV